MAGVYQNEHLRPKMDKPVGSNIKIFDLWLFASDLVNFVFLESSQLPKDRVSVHFPGFICKEFSSTLKSAIRLMRDKVKGGVDERFTGIEQQKNLNPDAYKKYTKQLRQANLRQGFEAEKFLYYCVRVAYMAYRFYYGGVRKAQILAVFSVAEDQEFGLNYSVWGDFNEIADRILGRTSETANMPHPRPNLCRMLSRSSDYFTTPKVLYRGTKITSTERNNTCPFGIRAHISSKLYSENLPLLKQFTEAMVSNSCVRMNNTAKSFHERYKEVIQESLNSSLEQLSISSTLPSKITKDEYASNSTPLKSSAKWKLRTLKRIAHRNSFEKQIHNLSPINRIKAESVNFPQQ